MINFSVANPPNEKFTLIDIGAFDTLGYQQAYLKKYLPPTQLSDETRQILADRMETWLHGHKLESSDDMEEGDHAEPYGEYERIMAPNLSNLASDIDLSQQAAGTIFSKLLHDNKSLDPRDKRIGWSGIRVVVDEGLVLMAAASWFSKDITRVVSNTQL
ncbi:hypothetical protein CPB86DRAFT_830817 [Serendipita vermifera]|nr:hypothetical protein CPB86DRAFT_830817 [Serendipita vermifera]